MVVVGSMKGLLLGLGLLVADPCMLVTPSDNRNGVVTYDRAMACLDSFPLTERIREGTLETLRQTLEFSANQGTSAMKGELARIGITQYSSERKFHMDITQSYVSMYDVDFSYTSACATSFRFQLPLMVRVIMGQDGESRVIATKVLSTPHFMWSHLDLDLLDYSDVLSIEGKPALEYLQEFADTRVGKSKDPGARLGLVLAHKKLKDGYFGIYPGLFSESPFPPARPAIAVELRLRTNKTKSLNIPYAVHVPPIVKDRNSMYNALCKESPLPHSLARRDAPTKGVYTRLYRTDNTGASLFIGTFAPIHRPRWYDEIQASISILKKEGRTNLIVDVSNIIDGDICLAVHLAELLSSEPLPELTWDWNNNAKQVHHTSHQNIMECPATSFKYTPSLNVTIATNGVCLSTCRLFISLLRSKKTYIITGPYPTAIPSGNIGAPIDLNHFTTLFNRSNTLLSPPPPFPVKATTIFTPFQMAVSEPESQEQIITTSQTMAGPNLVWESILKKMHYHTSIQ